MQWVITFWVALFLLGSTFVGTYEKNHKTHQAAGIPEARLIQEMGQGWLAEAQMAERIGVSQVSLKKSPERKIFSVRVTLTSKEQFSPGYRDQLLQYLNYRGQSETGLPYEFTFL